MVRDLFVAQGHEGQLVVIVPTKDLVLVRLGHLADLSGWAPLGAWVEQVVKLFPDGSELSPSGERLTALGTVVARRAA